MKFKNLVLLLCLFVTLGKAQSLNRIANDLDVVIDSYGSLSPFSEVIRRESISLDFLEILEKSGGRLPDSIDPWLLIESAQYLMDSLFYKLFYHLDFLNHRPEDVLNIQPTLVSSDGRFYQYSFDENTGGSYRSQIVYYHYRAADGSVINSVNESDENSVLANDGYYEIHNLPDSLGQPRYLLSGGVFGCNTCLQEYLDLLRYDTKEKHFVSDFSLSIADRGFGSLINIQADADTNITVNYFYSDLNEGCDCESEELVEYYQQKCFQLYRYKNFNFHLAESRSWYGENILEDE
ncbi:MAG: hypothetical protein DA405_10800 [Bacteroidetes bacterium]|nr:MAG: hypothetical protein DA405_10800 [Bacteroidota bacterium]